MIILSILILGASFVHLTEFRQRNYIFPAKMALLQKYHSRKDCIGFLLAQKTEKKIMLELKMKFRNFLSVLIRVHLWL